MAGDRHYCYPNVSVRRPTQWSMHWAVHKVDFLRYATTKWDTSQPISWAMSATTLELSQPYNLSQMTGYVTTLPTPKMRHVSTSKHRGSGKIIGSVHFFDARVFSPLTHTYRSLPLSTCYIDDMSKKKEGLWLASKRNGVWMFFTSHLLSFWWHGTHCQSGVQEVGLNSCNQAQSALQPDS